MSKATTCSALNAEPISGNLLPLDGEVYLIDHALAAEDADRAFADLLNTVDWRQEHAMLFGKKIALPRLTAWYGSHGYSYSGIHHEQARLTPLLEALNSLIEKITRNHFNSVLINLYRNGQDTMYRIHGTTQPHSIGRAMSSGCIRMLNSHVADLYRRVPAGTRVVVL